MVVTYLHTEKKSNRKIPACDDSLVDSRYLLLACLRVPACPPCSESSTTIEDSDLSSSSAVAAMEMVLSLGTLNAPSS